MKRLAALLFGVFCAVMVCADNTGSNNGTAALPSQTGNSGKFLTTNGSAASWASAGLSPIPAGNILCNSTGSSATPAACGSLPAIDSSAGLVTATGSTTARSQATRAAEVYNVADWCGGGCTTSTQQTNAALAIAAAITASSSGKGTIYYPAGTWAFDCSIAGPMVFSTYGVSIRGDSMNTTGITVTHGCFAKWTLVSVNGGQSGLYNLRLFSNDNATSGDIVALDRVDFFIISNVFAGGGFNQFHISSSVSVEASNLIAEGHNTTTGSTLVLFDKTNSGTVNNSEIFFSNFNIRGDAASAYTNAIVLHNCDGCFFSNGHIGFSSGPGMLVQAQNTNDQIDGLHLIGVDFDCDGHTTNIGLDFETLAGQTGADGGHEVVGGSSSACSADGVKLNDSNLAQISFAGFAFSGNNSNGLNIQAGSRISVAGGYLNGNNISNNSSSNIVVAGTATGVAINGVAFQNGSSPVAADISISGAAQSVKIGSNQFSGGTNFTDTSSNVTTNIHGTFANADAASPPAIGATTPAAANFTSMSANAGGGFTGGNVIINNGGTFVTNIGTGTSTGTVTIGNGSGGAIALNSQVIKVGNNLWSSTTVPSVTAGGGTGPTVTGTGTASFTVTEGSTGTPSTTLSIGLPAAQNGWNCFATDMTSSTITARQSSNGTTTINMLFSAAPANSDVIKFLCGGN